MTLETALKHYNTLLKYKKRYYYDYDSAIELFVDHAKEGNPEAQYYLGECFYYGRGTVQHLESAASCLTISAEQGNSKACCLIAIMMRRKAFISDDIDYSDVHGVMNKVYNLYKRAIELYPENELAKYKLAELLYNNVLPGIIDKTSKPYSDTLEEVFRLCVQTSTVPQVYLLMAKTFPKPIHFYIKATTLGHMASLMTVSEWYFKEHQYDDMTWWYWWAVKYDPDYSNRDIRKVIKADKFLSDIYTNMPFDKTTKYYEMKKPNGYNRVYEEVHKMWFLRAYNRAKLMSDYVPYDEKMRITNEMHCDRKIRVNVSEPIYYDYTELFIYATMVSDKLLSAIKNTVDEKLYDTLIYRVIRPLNDVVVLKKHTTQLNAPETYMHIIDNVITKSSLEFSHNAS